MEFLENHGKVKRNKLKGCGKCGCDTCMAGFKNHHDHLDHMIGSGKITGEQMAHLMTKYHGSGFMDDFIHFFSNTGSTIASFIPFIGKPISMLWDKLPDIAETLSPDYHYPYRENSTGSYSSPSIPTPTPTPTPAPKPTAPPKNTTDKYIQEYNDDNKPHYIKGGKKKKPKTKETSEERRKRMAWVRSFRT